ncbi:MAG: hypothetical protein DSM106950_05870 [Stigonema ocellatum SAG 48.90 = DSM 106950]|nr:hypothetical protein [Stigonema ocellatum SAG 48.90 = DSM 106950]
MFKTYKQGFYLVQFGRYAAILEAEGLIHQHFWIFCQPYLAAVGSYIRIKFKVSLQPPKPGLKPPQRLGGLPSSGV